MFCISYWFSSCICALLFFIIVYSPDYDPSSLIETGIVWSTNFAVLKDIFAEVPDMDPSLYCATRFSIAGLVMLPSAFGHFGNFDLVLRSSYIGVAVMFGYVGQTMGMQSGSTASMSAFMCTLNVVWVAFLVGLYTRKWRVETWVAILFAIAGVGFLELAQRRGVYTLEEAAKINECVAKFRRPAQTDSQAE